MSRIDLANPLNLIGPYSQAVFLSAFWQEQRPNNIYIAGFGGGRLAMLYDHHFPMANIHGSDIDLNVLEVAKEYFGLSSSALKDVVAVDSREDLTSRDTQYDVIFLDVFIGAGEHVNHLSTVEFFELCMNKMTDKGVVVANLVDIDERMHQKIAAMQTVFKHCYIWEFRGAHVIFASNQNTSLEEIYARVYQFQNEEQLDFDLIEKAKMLKPCIRNIEIDALSDKNL